MRPGAQQHQNGRVSLVVRLRCGAGRSAGCTVPAVARDDFYRLVGDGSHEFGGRCCFVFLSRHNAISDHRLVGVDGGGVLHDNLLLSLVSVMVEPFAQHRYCPRGPVCELQVFRTRPREEKADALRRLAALVDGIVNPRENIVAIRKQKTSP